jgi:hypothetical protein
MSACQQEYASDDILPMRHMIVSMHSMFCWQQPFFLTMVVNE